ncbi:integrin alpha-X [Xyrauchen texanus]|uniref:integrin alpha-X n=1 Tax=Xyrauchen texanus TaxID=154827 RepID=UPI002242AFB9|nr:integrin alpha-X [Xyrauchen texanus]
MDQNFLCISLCILCVFQSVVAFNIDPVKWRSFKGPSESQNVAFGYKIIQRESSRVIVSDPLIQINQERRGKIYSCPVTQQTCSPLDINVPSEAVNMSLGLSMIHDQKSSKLAICGPTIPKNCKGFTSYNGMCFISENNVVKPPIPSSLRDCPGQIDIAFLLDGSGSVGWNNFNTMKRFVANVIKRFAGRDAQFAIAQYSVYCSIHYDFIQLSQKSTWEENVMNINYMGGGTLTANAIIQVVNDLFTPARGARPSANKILLVVTDGQSQDGDRLAEAESLAMKKNIIRFAIGVGAAFDYPTAREELNKIATDPDIDHVFKVTDFDALNSILQKLEENIIAIEGTQTSGDSSRMEFAQDGFSTAFTLYGSVLLSAVGAYQWKGGYEEYAYGSFQSGSEHDSYLGYSMAIATLSNIHFVILGAPRYKHQGQVIVSLLRSNSVLSLIFSQPQIGSYFGAEVCVVDLNSDAITDLLLVSAPTYTEADREGKVFIYSFLSCSRTLLYQITVLVGMAGQRGRFGSSLSSPADLNGDGFMDVLIGAPLEEDGQGSIYIFNGGVDRINPTYSQRIAGSSVQPGLRFFGISLSQSSLDQSGDNLPDIAVGSMGAVLIFRSRPIMRLETKVIYKPSKIPTSETDCQKTLENTLTVCFTMSAYKHAIADLAAKINYTIKLDAKRQKFRAYFSKDNRVLNDQMTVGMKEECKDHRFIIDACSEDSLNPLSNQLTFIFEGLPSTKMEDLRPILLPEIKNTSDHNLDFEINCGTDNLCEDEIRMDFNTSGSTNIEVGIMQEINVTVFVENRGENSYNTDFTLKYPFGLSYRRITSKQGRVECVSLDGEPGVLLGETICHISSPILKAYAQAVFEITYIINRESMFGNNVTFSASVKSGNDKHSENSELSKEKTIGVKYAIYIALIRHENSSIHINFTAGKKDLQRPVQQILKVENDFRELAFKVFIRVPVKLGDINIWTNTDLQILGCKKNMLEQPVITNFMEVIKNQHVVNCSVAACEVFSCDVNLMKNERKLYYISENVSSGWIEQNGLRAATFQLVSTASLDYDKSKYVFFSTDSQHTAITVQINTQVEVYEEVDQTKEVIGGVIGGLLLLALITAALYKAGFFKSRYKQMLEDANADAGGEPLTEQ